jgi:flagellar operon protein
MNPLDSIGSTDVRSGRHVGPPADPFGQLGRVDGSHDRLGLDGATIQPGRHVGPIDRPASGQPAGTTGHGTGSTSEPSFAATLSAAASDNDLHLSSHALHRIEQRGIGLGQPEFDRLSGAFDQLAGKGGRQSLVLVDHVAYVVHVPSRTVVTAVAPDERNDSNVFTRIDSVVIA